MSQPARACENSLITQSLVNDRELRSDPSCGAAFIVHGAYILSLERWTLCPCRRGERLLEAVRAEDAGPIKLMVLERSITGKLLAFMLKKVWLHLSPLEEKLPSCHRWSFSEVVRCPLC